MVSIDSLDVRSGRIVGTRLASIVLPEPGGPIISRLWPPAAATMIARLAISWPRTSAEIDLVVGQFAEQVVQPRGRRLDLDFARQEGDGLGQALHGDDLDAFDDGRFRRAFGRHDQPSDRLVLGRGNRHRQGPLGRARGAVEGQFADDGVLGELFGGHLPAADERAQGDRQIERGGVFGQVGRGQVDDDAALRALEARVDHRPLDAMRAFLDGRLGKADQDLLGQSAGGDIDLDLDGQGLDADEREGFEFGEHRRVIPLSGRARAGASAFRSVTGILSSSTALRKELEWCKWRMVSCPERQ